MKIFFRNNWILIGIMITASFFYTFRLHQTFVMAGDTARDLIDIQHIWQNKIITLVGEPVNTISNNPIQVLFGSLYLYIGLIGLLITKFDPVGSLFLDIVVTLLSIPFFYILSKDLLKKKSIALISTSIYAFSPITIALTRSFWEPNIVLPISVFVWFFFLHKKSVKNYLIAGLLSGIIFDIHYMNIIPIAFYIFLLLFQKNKKYFLSAFIGFLIAISPFSIFEIKHNFFLTKAFIGTFSGFSTFSERSLNPFLSLDIILYIFGLGPYQYFIPQLINISYFPRIILDTILGIFFFILIFKKNKFFGNQFIFVLIVGLLSAWFFERWHLIGLRYVLPVFPLFIISVVSIIFSLNKYLILLPVIPMIILSFNIVLHKLDPTNKEDYYPVSVIQKVSNAIVEDNPKGSYNVTENILGDARSLATRFYLMRDAKVLPQPVEIYNSIDSLYVITTSLEKTYQENRWEFRISGLKKIAWEKEIGDLKLYKFVK